MSSPLMPPIKMLTPIPENDKMLKYRYFVQFDPIVYYQPYHAVMDLILPYWHNKDEYTGEEVADLLRQLPHIATLEHEALIDSCVGVAICNWVMHIHDTLPHQCCISNWHYTVAHMAPEVLTCLSPNAPFPREDGFNMDDLPTPLESYLLQCTVPEGALLRPGLVANNKDFPGHVFDCFPTLLPDAADEEEVIIFKSPPKKESLSTPAHPQATSSTTPALPVPPWSTYPQKTPISLVPPIVNLPGVSPSLCNFLCMHTLGTVLSSPVSPPSLLAGHQAPPLWSSFSPVKPLGLYHRPTGTTPITPSQHAMLALQSTSLSHSLQDMASSIQDLCQALLTPGSGVGLHSSDSAGATASATNNITSQCSPTARVTPPSRAMPLNPLLSGTTEHPLDKFNIPGSSCFMRWQPNPLLQHYPASPLPPVSGQGDFASIPPLLFVHEEPTAPMTPPPPLPEEEQPSTIVEELPSPGNFMDVDAPPSPPRIYHLVTSTPLHSGSLVVHSPSPKVLPSNCGDEIQQCKKRKKKKAKGKGKAVVLSPEPSPPPVAATSADIATSLSCEEPPSLPKKVLKRKHAPSKTVPSEPGPSKLTHARVATPTAAVIPSDAEASDAVCPTIKKPWFSPKKASKKKSSHRTTKSTVSDAPQDSNWMFLGYPKQQYLAAELTQAQNPGQEGIPINRHNSCTELENYCFKDLVTSSDEFFDPVYYGHKNSTYCACSLCYAYYMHAPDHYEKTCLPCVHHQANCTWNNWFPGADCDQCQERCHGGCSTCYTTYEMHEIISHLTTFVQYNIPALCCNIMQLHGINCKLEHIDYLYRGHLHARNCVVHDITESLDQFTSAEGGNELIKDLSHAYSYLSIFLRVLSMSSDNNTSMWDEGEDKLAAGPSGVQGDDDKGEAGASK
ncbi:hypothetical protein ARMGADRAFT_1038859 [Armillaria gallica]|uniref:Uncharacterized protein n=1 Tax=Armillaria gallica TaxID=47427 RepID=A0A2H3CJM2_ARMGA|nr:hypothetical protein ARMGADRAFT_1038859 [Armillaria gallica]